MAEETNNLQDDELIDEENVNQNETSSQTAVADDKTAEYLAGWQRALADYKNLQEKSKFQATLSSEMARASVFSDLAPVIDNFTAALTHVPEENKNNDWVIGLGHVKQQLLDVCRQHGLELIDKVDVEFDPTIHEAISYQPSELAAGQVVTIVAVGMRLGEKVIRPARVIVSSEPKNYFCYLLLII